MQNSPDSAKPGRPAIERRRPHGGEPIKLALLGCGVVGGGVLSLLAKNAAQITERVGVPVAVHRVLVRDPSKPRVAEAQGLPITTSLTELTQDEEIDVFVEVMGGLDPAGDAIDAVLSRGRSVVTANKALLAARGVDLFQRAREHRADLAFEAAVGGGIPIVRTLRDAAASDEIASIAGILNGTSNYILTEMTAHGAAYADALAGAQARGFAEADPTLDVGGYDAAQKLLVLSMLAFGAKPPRQEDMLIEGIASLERSDLELVDKLGFGVKHLVVGKDHGTSLELRAHPALLKKSSVFANVSGALNAVKIEGRALGPLFMSGRGAGDLPTAVSVVADIIEVSRNLVAGAAGLLTGQRPLEQRAMLPASDFELRYYLRFDVRDEPGVLATIARALAEHEVSISQIIQSEASGGQARIVIITHVAKEGAVARALAAAAGLVTRPPVLLRIEDLA